MADKRDTLQDKIITSAISETEWKKVHLDLRFIGLMTQVAKSKGCRVIVSGGYAVDGSLGKITRPHRDIDIQIYGQGSSSSEIVGQLIASVKMNEPELTDVEVKDKGRQQFYHAYFAEGNGLGSDLYYVQVTGNPFDQEKYVVKADGTVTDRQEFDTTQVTLEGVTFEAIMPTSELVDKLYKRLIRGDQPKPEHDQDIANLRLITNAQEIETSLDTLRK